MVADDPNRSSIPSAPTLPPKASHGRRYNEMARSPSRDQSYVSTATRDLWDQLFDTGYKADIMICTDHGGGVYAHSHIIGMASPTIRGMIKKSKKQGRYQKISIRGVPGDAVRVFIRFLYSSCFEKADMDEHVLPLLVLSHVYVVPQLKRECERWLVHGGLNTENVVDVFQLALLCDAPRLSLICHRMILASIKAISLTEGWQAMKQSHPVLEKDLLKSIIDEENMQKEIIRKKNERKIYLQLHEAMEALVHICRDGCRTIGPHDKAFNKDQQPCRFEACKGLELLIRHFAECKLRVPGGCIHCKRMWQLLELHARLCVDSSECRVPLCRKFKDRLKKQTKKDEKKWRVLARKTLRSKSITGAPYFSLKAQTD